MDLLSGYFTRFNSTLVQLKVLLILEYQNGQHSFNSTLVQLKAKLGMRCSIPENKFQFYLSSIKRVLSGCGYLF